MAERFIVSDARLDAEARDVKSIEGMADGATLPSVTAGPSRTSAPRSVVIVPRLLLTAEEL